MISGEQVFDHNGRKVKYKRKPSKQDNRHLIVIFSGILPIHRYAFDGAMANDLKSEILWIKDDFDGENAYYVCQNMSFDVLEAVNALIGAIAKEKHLSRDAITLMGFSKGGAAALLFGLKFDYRNILATVPQTRIGSYVREHYPRIFASMMRTGSDEEVAHIDELTVNALRVDWQHRKNIYIFSSEADVEFSTQIAPLIPDLGKYSNFNLFMTRSKLVHAHHAVTRYNVPLILSILHALGEGAAPRFGRVENGNAINDSPARADSHFAPIRQESETKAVVDLERVIIRGDMCFPEGVGFLKGFSIPNQRDSRRTLIFRGKTQDHPRQLASLRKEDLSAKYYDQYFCDYTMGGFASPGSAGFSIADLPTGSYTLHMLIETSGAAVEVKAKSSSPRPTNYICDNRIVTFKPSSDASVLQLRDPIGAENAEAHFEVRGHRVDGFIYHVEGVFIVPGIEVNDYRDNAFLLVLKSEHQTIAVPMFMSHRADLNSILENGDYSKSYFTTRKYQGVSLESYPPGVYRAYITLAYGTANFSEELPHRVEIREAGVKVHE